MLLGVCLLNTVLYLLNTVLYLSMTLNCGWEDLSLKVPSSKRAGVIGGVFSQEKPPSLIHASGVS